MTNPLYFQFGSYQQIIELLVSLFPDGEDKPPRLKDERAQAWTVNTLANSYSASGLSRRSVPMCEIYNALQEKAENKKNLAIGLANEAQHQLVIGALGEAERNLRRSIDLCREIADDSETGTCLYELGRILAYCGRWAESDEKINDGEKIKKRADHAAALGIIASYRALRALQMARSQYSPSNLKIGIKFGQKAIAFADEWTRTYYPLEREYVSAHWLLGAAYRASGDLPQAETHLGEALRRCRAINLVENEADILLELAKLRHAQGNRAESLRLVQEALVITERSGYVLQGADVHLWLAELAWEERSEKGLSGKEVALMHAKEALRLAHCDDGPPYYYKVAYEEAERMIEKLSA